MRKGLCLHVCLVLIALLTLTLQPIAGCGKIRPPAIVQQQNPFEGKCSAWCSEPRREGAFYVIDANTGKIIDRSADVEQVDQVAIILVNKNPFKYKYAIRTEPLDEKLVMDFLNLIPGFGDVISGAIGQLPTPAPGAELCTGQTAVNDAKSKYDAKLEEVSKISGNLKKELGDRDAILTEYNNFLKDTDTESVTCERTCERAVTLFGNLDKLIETDELTKMMNQLNAGDKGTGHPLSRPGIKSHSGKCASLHGFNACGEDKTSTGKDTVS